MGNLQTVEDMAFGTVLVSTQSGTVTVTPSGAVSVQGGVFYMGGGQQAIFRNTGNQSTQVTLTVPGSATVVSGSNSMIVDDFTSSTTFEQQGNNGAIFVTFNVGATININGGQPSGDYIGDFTVIAVFQ